MDLKSDSETCMTMTILVICNCELDETTPELIQWPEMSVNLEVSTV